MPFHLSLRPAGLASATALFALATATGCSSTLATIQGPDHLARLSQPQPVTVTLGPQADANSFTASLNGQDITAEFTPQGETFSFADHCFNPGAQHVTVRVAATQGKNTLEQTLQFYPPALSAQGNVGQAPNSRVRLTESGSARIMVKLPSAPRKTVTMTLTPQITEGEAPVALGNAQPGQPLTLTFPAGSRVATLVINAPTAGSAVVKLSAPGYATALLPVDVQPALAEIVVKGGSLNPTNANETPKVESVESEAAQPQAPTKQANEEESWDAPRDSTFDDLDIDIDFSTL